ncbi:MAG TPA: hypothetical protein PKE40_00735 [Arachnia sp.]|nr:hypothetical protein [Arachnia sp.]HMT84852.1 hypothetical protein [Arachnia sp.]
MSIRDVYSSTGHRHDDLLQHAGEASWAASREERAARFHRGRACPTRAVPYGPADPFARRVREICTTSGCLDLHHDLIARILAKVDVADSRIADLKAYAYRIASHELVDLKRAERAGRGLPSKPGRSDGVAGRVIAELDAPDQVHRAWLIVLFRILRSYPFSPYHVPGRWPVDGLVEQRTEVLPDEPSSASTVRREIRHVLATATIVAGHDWVYTNITLPLCAHGAPLELTDRIAGGGADADAEIAILGPRLRGAYLLHRMAGAERSVALERASLEVTGLPAPGLTAEIASALEELEPPLAAAA